MDVIPLQEREEWLSYWAVYGDMPYFIVEFGAPLQFAYHRSRNCGPADAPTRVCPVPAKRSLAEANE
jgi:hypothetical protein